MANPKAYVGVGDKARKVKKIYVGVNGVARKVKKAYVGVNGVAKLVYRADWWLSDTVSESDVLAAYNFKGADSSAEALKDLTGNNRTLTNSGCSWSSNGFYVDGSHYLDHSSLRSSGSMKSIVMKISGVWGGNYKALTGNWGGISVWIKTPFCILSYAWRYYHTGVAHGAGTSIDATSGSANLARENVRLMNGEISGVVGFSNTGWGALYQNGSAVGLSNAKDNNGKPWTWWQTTNVGIPRLVGGTGKVSSDVVMNGYFTIEYLAIYNKVLNASEHAAIYSNIIDIV